jgi:twitching motility two-component system response regulator PilG
MIVRPYLSNQLLDVVQSLQETKTNGLFQVKARLDSPNATRERILMMYEGNLVYGSSKNITPLVFAHRLGKIFKPKLIDTALQVAQQKLTNPQSVQEILTLLVKMRVLSWEQIHLFVFSQLVWTLEQLQPYPGKIRLEETTNFDLRGPENDLGITWEKIGKAIAQRQREWQELAPVIPSMEAIPFLPKDGISRINDPKVAAHLRQWVNGDRSLIDIADQMLGQDPLKIARSYFRWKQMEWVAFRDTSTPEPPSGSLLTPNRATILAVDDSPIVQTMIRRALSDRYNVLIASNAVEALNLLNSKSIQLLLLDVTMPDMDGLEVCRTLRAIPKFRDLPIIMLTARDGHVDKCKGYMAGSTKYLTKPFQAEELLAVIAEYVHDGVIPAVKSSGVRG